jgi:hypothetical protein
MSTKKQKGQTLSKRFALIEKMISHVFYQSDTLEVIAGINTFGRVLKPQYLGFNRN